LTVKKTDVEKAIKDSMGLVTVAARRLGISRSRFYQLKEKWPEMDEWITEEREALLDLTESKLIKNVTAGREASIFFTLKTLGKHRGFIERSEITGKDGEPIKLSLSDRLKQIKKGE